MTTQEEIKQRQEKSRKIVQDRKDYQQKMKAGRKYFVDNDLDLFSFKFGDITIFWTFVTKFENCAETHLDIIWCACSPQDYPSEKVARGILGSRIVQYNKTNSTVEVWKHSTSLTYFDSRVLMPFDVKRMESSLKSYIFGKCISNNKELPNRIRREFKKFCR